ncbi:APH(3')-V family aminoglycoside O-phosphotransferase [Streptomyces sp. NPDC048603]|uniref:APH(3')-V family aminoglycoside O-phosphotransferase n=1 Tax=Streptomyces sp. NPDC048603 TaxID=3365577 RepID=UPI003716125A
MPSMDSTLRSKYPHHEWTSVNEGDSGAFVYHLTGHEPELYAKIAPRSAQDAPENWAFDLAGEADRLEWLARHGIPAPRIVERGADATSTWLVTEALPGVAASEEWPEHQRFAVVEAIAGLARALHELPVDDCPFDRGLTVTVTEARHNVRAGLVDLDDLQEEHEGWSGEELLAELDRTRPEDEDLVVCHGDLCPNNILLDPDTCEVTGVIDVGRLGRADRHADLALAARELEIDEDPWFGPAYAEHFLVRYGVQHVEKDKMTFYQLLDELF